MLFEWDENKREANLAKHGIDFVLAAHVFENEFLNLPSAHASEKRWLAVGNVGGKMLTVVYTIRDEALRIISARRARDNEIRAYRQIYTRRDQTAEG
ncbi:MAG: BrnT family toxin [Alphaproteobacteria bacterium]|nr:BrnT family toxin [Alphaproteobacteria bacterium]